MNERRLRFVRALGWATLTAAPILLVALALVSSRPETPPSLVTEAALLAWVAGALAFGGSLVRARSLRAARITGAAAALVVAGACALMTWSATEQQHVVALDAGERADLVRDDTADGARWVHPTLGFSLPAVDGMAPAPAIARESEEAGGPSWARAHRVFAWRAGETEIVADLSRAPAADRAALEQVKDELAGQLARNGHVQRAEATSATNAELEATVPGGEALVRALLFRRHGRAYRLVVTVLTSDAVRWQRWLRDVRVDPAPR